MFFKATQSNTDYKKLNSHIAAMIKQQSPGEIIHQTAVCLEDILDCRLVSFVLKKEGRTVLNHGAAKDRHGTISNLNDLSLYEINEENCCSRIYIRPAGKKIADHDHILNMILQGCSWALFYRLKIDDLTHEAMIDPLTGCYNRREFEIQLRRVIAGACRHNSSVSLFMFDIDHFKQINDSLGHLAGDQVLKQLAHLVQQNIRTCDILTRYGGDEFIVILPDTRKEMAIALADRLRNKISKKTVEYMGHAISMTASFGVSELKQDTEMTRIIQDADAMLYQAKSNGRNLVMPALMKILPPFSTRGITHFTPQP